MGRLPWRRRAWEGELAPFAVACLATLAALALPRLLAAVQSGGAAHGLRRPLLDYGFGVLAALALLPTLRLWRGGHQRALRWIWLAKAATCLVAMPFYEAHYAGLDAFAYHRVATSGEPVAFGFGTQLVFWLAHQLAPLLGGSYHALKVAFAYAGLAGVYLCVRAFEAAAGRPRPAWLWALALFPSTLFWSSILGKDPLVLLGIGLVAWGVAKAWRQPAWRFTLAMAAGLLLAAAVRPWMAVLAGAALLAVAPWGLRRGLRWPSALARQAPLVLAFCFALYQVGGILPGSPPLAAGPEGDGPALDGLDGPGGAVPGGGTGDPGGPAPGGEEPGPEPGPGAGSGGSGKAPAGAQGAGGCRDAWLCRLNAISRSWATGGSSQRPPFFESWMDVLAFLPLGAFTAWFRPLPGEILSPLAFGLASGLANAALLTLVVRGAWRARWRHLANPFVIFLVLLLGLWSGLYAFLSYQNLGSAVRFKVQVEPLLVGLALLLASRGFLPAPQAPAAGGGRPRLLLVLNQASGFAAQRLALARAAQDAGFEVHVAVPAGSGAAEVTASGLPVHEVPLSRRGLNPWRELRSARELARLLRRLRPHIVHCFTVKPIVYGGLAARRAGVPAVHTVTGLGYAFLGRSRRARALRRAVEWGYRLALRHPGQKAVFQNGDDLLLFEGRGLVLPDQAVLIPGSGVDTARFRPAPAPPGPPLVVLPARMLWDKGVGEFVQAARRLRAQGVAARFALVGGTDPGNRAAIPDAQLRAWQAEGDVEWWGWREDMVPVYAQASVACLPSYGEGVPRALLEAAACGLPLVAADVPGCRDVALEGRTGWLCRPRDAASLADALRTALSDPAERSRRGAAARRLAEERFDQGKVLQAYVGLYQGLVKAEGT